MKRDNLLKRTLRLLVLAVEAVIKTAYIFIHGRSPMYEIGTVPHHKMIYPDQIADLPPNATEADYARFNDDIRRAWWNNIGWWGRLKVRLGMKQEPRRLERPPAWHEIKDSPVRAWERVSGGTPIN